jgi:hypothetical protein
VHFSLKLTANLLCGGITGVDFILNDSLEPMHCILIMYTYSTVYMYHSFYFVYSIVSI